MSDSGDQLAAPGAHRLAQAGEPRLGVFSGSEAAVGLTYWRGRILRGAIGFFSRPLAVEAAQRLGQVVAPTRSCGLASRSVCIVAICVRSCCVRSITRVTSATKPRPARASLCEAP